MTIIEALILGAVQGITEFLPVSSSGHLLMFSELFGIETDFVFFSIVVHVATLLAVLIVFRKKVLWLVKNPFSKEAMFLVLATIPAALVGVLFSDILETVFYGSFYIVGFVITAVVLFIGEWCRGCTPLQPAGRWGQRPLQSVIVMGIAQAFAVLPGISRSGTTITAGILFGKTKEEAAEFSFLMAIPIILGGLFFELIKLVGVHPQMNPNGAICGLPPTIDFAPLLFGFISAFLFGMLAINLMLRVVKTKSFKPFIVYLVLLSIVLSVKYII
ncbi:MAG: undecaprenyl-diphosphate phosphatase [Firmicutes bacterium]|nr:undecaprenyl-diphosphate phosphatase [Bacillota bacterium]MCL2771182.1 undecaprenyl-diphosphate phosphatase [Bacillota bacterium]